MIMYLSNYFVANPFQRQARLGRATAMPAVCASFQSKYSDNFLCDIIKFNWYKTQNYA